MAITGAQYIELCKRFMAEDSTDASNPLFTDDWILAFLNAGQVKIVRDVRCNHFSTTVTQDATSSAIALSDNLVGDIYATLAVSSTDRRDLKVVPSIEMDRKNASWQSDTAQYPTQLVVTQTYNGYTVKLYPAPSATITNGLILTGTRKPTALTAASASSELFPNSYFADLEPILLPAAAMTLLPLFEGGTKDDQFGKWKMLYKELIQDYAGRLNTLFIGREKQG